MDFIIKDANQESGNSFIGISNPSAMSGIGPGNALPITTVPSITDVLATCNMPACDYDADMQCVDDLVAATICEAKAIIESDPRGLFCYKLPKHKSSSLNILANEDGDSHPSQAGIVYTSSGITRRVLTIDNFEYSNAIADIKDFISLWELSPDTKCVVISNPIRHEVPIKGTIYFVDAHFSRPTPQCPNPLAVAKVRFIVSISNLLLRSYPVMITYRFEGYNTLYYGLGERSLNLFSFQRFYIDTILHTKLSFFAAVAECRHGTVENPKENVKSKKNKKCDKN